MNITKKLLPKEIPLPPLPEIICNLIENRNDLNMNDIVKTHNILFICLDCLRYDVAISQQNSGGTPILDGYGPWEKRGATGNFTYPSHHAMFAGFLPTSLEPTPMTKKKMLFFHKGLGFGKVAPPKAFAFQEPTFIQGLEAVGYNTICIGGVSYFSKRTAMGKVFPAMFKQSYWNPSFACTVKKSPDNQINKALEALDGVAANERIMMYINFDAIHYPNHFYLDGAKKDSIESHAAALRYIDARLPKLFDGFKKRGKTFVIACSDHGTCYEDTDEGYHFHGFNHEVVNTVPYKHFFL